MKNTGLIIIDTQVALFDNSHPPLYREYFIIDGLQRLIGKARRSNTPIIYIQHTEPNGDFKRHSPTWQIHPEIAPSIKDTVIEKTSWDAFLNTSLEDVLNELNITHLVLAGMQTEYCLDTSLRCGYSKGFEFTVIGDVHTTVDAHLKAEAIITHHNNIWDGRFAKVVHSDSFEF